jgi:transposase InsO family protein
LKKNHRKKISLARDIVGGSPGISKQAVAKQFGIARSTLYRPGVMALKDKQYLEDILRIMQENPDYGQPRIALAMGRNLKLVKRVMKKYGLKTKKRKKRFVKTDDQGKADSTIPNRIKHLCPISPDAFWVGDFTYFAFHGTYVFLATVIDLYTKEVVGWNIGLHHSATLVIEALDHARRNRERTPQVFHSDQGSEYDSAACKAWLLAHGIVPSHSRKASPWQNGSQESFFGRFKEEFGNINRFTTLDALMEAIYGRIRYYNTKRIHRTIKMAPRAKYLEYIKQNQAPEISEEIRRESVA